MPNRTETVTDPLVAPAVPRSDSLGYHESLDGLRGLALLAIIVYHSGLGWAPGAFLSVSTFFTLSGFLITALMLAEHHRTGSVSLRGFWSRRLRRLMPAALSAIALIVVASIWLADSTQWARLRGDALASVAYVANWRFIAVGDSYGAAFSSPSPFTHFWTLAIEEQFYILLPIAVISVLVATRGSRRALTGMFISVSVASLFWANWLIHRGVSVDRLYFGTDVRVPELLAGSLLGVWWMRHPDPVGPRVGRLIRIGAPMALVALPVLWVTADLTDVAFYRGGLSVYSLLTIVVILGALQEEGPVRRVLAWRPLVWMGVLSYGAYLLHFPVLSWLEQHTGLAAWQRLILAFPITFGLAMASARFIERPIRKGAPKAGRAGLLAIATPLVVIALIFAVTGSIGGPDSADLEAAARWQKFVKQTEAQNRSDAPRLGMFGDSTALMSSRGLVDISREHPDRFVTTVGWTNLGCSLLTTGSLKIRNEVRPREKNCSNWLREWKSAAKAEPSDVAAVLVGPWEVTDQQVVAGGPFLTIGKDPALDEALTAALRSAIDELLVDNGIVVLILPPDVDVGRVDGKSPRVPFPESDHSRMEKFREILRRVAAENDKVETLDMNAWLSNRTDERRLRPDGVHFTDTTSPVVGEWLGDQLVRIYTSATGRTRSAVHPD